MQALAREGAGLGHIPGVATLLIAPHSMLETEAFWCSSHRRTSPGRTPVSSAASSDSDYEWVIISQYAACRRRLLAPDRPSRQSET